MKHLTEEELVLLYYSEPGTPADAPAHLRECAECRESAAALARTLSICSEWTTPEPPADLGRSAWSQIAPRLHQQKQERAPSRFRLFWLVPALTAMLLVAFLAGRVTKHSAPPITAGLSDAARQRILAISLADHLDRAEMLLTEISNVGDFGPVRYRAQDMVEEGRLMRQTLSAQGQTATLALLDEVERFLLEVANSPDRASPEEIRSLRERMESGSLLFKVRIIESNLRTEGQKS